MRKTIVTLALAGLGLFVSNNIDAQIVASKYIMVEGDSVEMNYDSVITESSLVKKVVNVGDSISRTKEYEIENHKHYTSGNLVLETEDAYEIKRTAVANKPKNSKNSVQIDTIKIHYMINNWEHDSLNKLVKAKRSQSNYSSKGEEVVRITINYNYQEGIEKPMKIWHDLDNNGKESEGDIIENYSPDFDLYMSKKLKASDIKKE